MTRLPLKIHALSRLTSIDGPDVDSSTTKKGGTHVQIIKPPYADRLPVLSVVTDYDGERKSGLVHLFESLWLRKALK